LHELNVEEGVDKYLHQFAYFVLISASFEECSSILTVIFLKLMEVTKKHILLYEFNKGNNVTEKIRIWRYGVPTSRFRDMKIGHNFFISSKNDLNSNLNIFW